MILKKKIKDFFWSYLIKFNFILLVYKSKFLVILLVSVIQVVFYFIFDISSLISLDLYGISLKGVKQEDIVLLYNIFAVNMLLINIIMLVFINQNLFVFDFDVRKHFESLKKDSLYWVSLFIVILFTLYYILYFPFKEIMTLYYLYSDCGIKYNLFLLGEFNSRYMLMSVYKILAIYVAFGSSNRPLGYRLLTWFFLITLLKIASLNSCYIVDAMVYFLAVHPEVVNLKDFSWRLCFDSVMSYLMEDGNRKMTQEERIKYLEEENKKMREVLQTRRDSVMPIVTKVSPSLISSNNNKQEVNERIDHCLNEIGPGLNCLVEPSTWTTYMAKIAFPYYGAKLDEADKEGKAGVEDRKRGEHFKKCLENDNWRQDKELKLLQTQQEMAKKAVEDQKLLDEEHWRRHP